MGEQWISNEEGEKYMTGEMLCTANYYAPRIFPKYVLSGHK